MTIDEAIENYNNSLAKGQLAFANADSGGERRYIAGDLFESLTTDLVACTDRTIAQDKYVRSQTINGLSLGNLQVDRHISHNGAIESLCECKTYLDACYLKRAVFDFNQICLSPDVPDVKKLGILTGQICVSPVTRVFTLDLAHQLTGIDVEIFVVNTTKRRSGDKQLLDPQYGDNFALDISELQRFIDWVSE